MCWCIQLHPLDLACFRIENIAVIVRSFIHRASKVIIPPKPNAISCNKPLPPNIPTTLSSHAPSILPLAHISHRTPPPPPNKKMHSPHPSHHSSQSPAPAPPDDPSLPSHSDSPDPSPSPRSNLSRRLRRAAARPILTPRSGRRVRGLGS